MATGVNLFELSHCYWEENNYEPIPASASALFFFLIELANNRYWKMPVRCQTSQISRALKISEQTVLNSRDTLFKRGMISFTNGHGNSACSTYTIVTDPKNWAIRMEDHLVDRFGDDLEDGLENALADRLNIYNNKDIKIKNKISSLNKAKEEKNLSLDELEGIFLSDSSWHEDLISLLSPLCSVTADDIKRLITAFFLNLKCQGVDRREEKDCKTHFVNWIKKLIKSNNYGISATVEPDKRRGSPITATSAGDYAGSF